MKVRKVELENEKLKSELKIVEIEDEAGEKRKDVDLEEEEELLKELKESDELNQLRIIELIKKRDKLKKEEANRISARRNTSPISTRKNKTTSTLRDNPYYEQINYLFKFLCFFIIKTLKYENEY